MKPNKLIIPLLPILLSQSYTGMADRVVTTRKHLKVAPTTLAAPSSNADTIANPSGITRFCGYEKKLRATRETLFIENLSDSTIESISFTIDYIDSSGRQIHRRALRKETYIPPHQTRRLDIQSWDTQKSYYYIHGEHPRKSATPYDITITTDTILLAPCTR